MTPETHLRVQAWLDGELSSSEAAEARRLTQSDPEAAALARELEQVRSWLAGNEWERTVPESREFYWSRIRRMIEAAAPATGQATTASPPTAGWLRWLVPAALAPALAIAFWASKPPPLQDARLQPAEIDSAPEDMGSITFRSDAEQMTVIWVNGP